MRIFGHFLSCTALLCASVFGQGETLTTFRYTQTDLVTGSGTIAAPPSSVFNGVTITWTDTAMPTAGVRDAAGGGAAGGFVGTWDSPNGDGGPAGEDVALYWNNGVPDASEAPSPIRVEITGSGDDGNAYTLSVPLVFWGNPTDSDTSGADPRVQDDALFDARTELGLDAPDPEWGNNDYQWSLDYQTVADAAGVNPDHFGRTAMWFSPTWATGNNDFDDDGIVDTGGRVQRFTQINFSNQVAGNTINLPRVSADSSDMPLTATVAENDAIDGDGLSASCGQKEDLTGDGVGDCTSAVGLPLEFGFGWRDMDEEFSTGVPVSVDNFMVAGLLEYDESLITLSGGNGIGCDLDGDNDCDNDDINLLYDNDGDIAQWLSDASTTANPANPGAAATFVVGDLDLNGDVNSSDLGLLLNNFGLATGQATLWGGGDIDDSGDVNSSDLGALLNNFGFQSAAAVSAVPEPSGSTLLLAIAGMMFYAGRRNRK